MASQLIAKFKDSLYSLLPIFLLVLLLSFTIVPLNGPTLTAFIISSILLWLGLSLFTLGAEKSMMPMGNKIGSQLTKSRNVILIVIVFFLLGTIITIAEPDLTVLANQISSIPSTSMILAVSIGVGSFLVIAMLRILFKINLNILLLIFYGLLIIITLFSSSSIIPIAFDSGGVTTGPITVPFIIALGIGISSVLGGKHSQEDSFGLVALCSIGPILIVLILGFFYNTNMSHSSITEIYTSYNQIGSSLIHNICTYFIDVIIALSPIFVFFIIFQLVSLKLPKSELIKMMISLSYTFFGLVIFLGAVNTGFLPVGYYLGETLGESYRYILIPLGFLIGFFVVFSEPAVHVLNEQVEEISSGTISKKSMLLSLSIGVAISIALSMIRILAGFSIMYFIIPGYLIAVALSFFVPRIYTAIAFDSGGVASGPMTATFILPFAIGLASTNTKGSINDAFGIVAMVALTPLITIQLLGLISTKKVQYMNAYLSSYVIDDVIYDFK